MADVMRRVVTLFEVRGANDIRAKLGQMRSGFAENRQEMDRWGKTSGYVNNQLRALGTTIRYAFAGTAIFGTLAMVKNLGDFQAKLGEIQAIATGPNGLPLLDRQIDDLGTRLINVSNETTQPIADLQEGVLSLYSTIGNVPPNQAADMMDEISKVAITSQSNIQDTTQALLGMLNAFGRGTKELPKFGDEFFKVIQLSAGMPGSIYAQKLGPLSASAALGNFTPEQMGALAIGATRFGGAPSTNMTYLAQMMMYLMHPTTSKAKAALSSVGLGTAQREKLGGYATLKKFLAAVNSKGGVGMTSAFAGASDDFLSQAEQQGLSATDVGLKGGGASLISSAFGRIQSQRMAAVLSRLMTPGQVAGTENKTLDQYLAQVTNSANSVNTAMGRAMDYRRINQAGNAMHNFGVELGTALSPLLQYPARGITGGASAFNKQKWGIGPVTGQELELGGAAVGTFALIRALRRGGGGGGLIRGIGGVGAATDLLSGDTQRGHSPANPLYVAVVYSLSGPGGAGFRRGVPTEGGPVGGIAGRGNPNMGAGRGSRLRSAGRSASRWFLPAAIAYELGSNLMSDYQSHHDLGQFHRGVNTFDVFEQHGKYFMQSAALRGRGGPGGAPRQITQAAAQALLGVGASGTASGQGIALKGKADITIHDERTKKKYHVPVDLTSHFTAPAPQTKGKDKTHRGGN